MTSASERVVDAMAEELSIKDFEAAIAELETIVKKLEDGDLTLESSAGAVQSRAFSSGVSATRDSRTSTADQILNERGE